MSTHAGEVIGRRWQLVRPLGRGGMATVWAAIDLASRTASRPAIERQVAVKLLHAELRSTPQLRARFKREAELLLGLEHPNLARVLDVDTEGERPYLVMERIEGWTLEEELARRSEGDHHFSTRELYGVFAQLCAAVGFAHSRGIVHRDLKPPNIMLEAPGGDRVKVLDFGIAKILEEERPGDATTQGRMLGSIATMAPEQARGEPVDRRSDIFSLGVIWFEMLTLRRAWARAADGGRVRAYSEPVRLNSPNSPSELLERIAEGPRPSACALMPGLPGQVDRVLERALAARPAARTASVEELLAGVREALGVRGVEENEEPDAGAITVAPAGEEAEEDLAPLSGVVVIDDRGDARWESVRERGGAVEPGLRPEPGLEVAGPPPQANVEVRWAAAQARAPDARRSRVLRDGVAGVLAVSAVVLAVLLLRVQARPQVEVTFAPDPAESVQASSIPRVRSSTSAAQGRVITVPEVTVPRYSTPHRPAKQERGETGAAGAGAVGRDRAPPAGAQAPGARLRARLLALEAAEGSASSAELVALAEAIAAEAEKSAPPDRRASIQRLARSSARLADLRGMERALDLLEESSR